MVFALEAPFEIANAVQNVNRPGLVRVDEGCRRTPDDLHVPELRAVVAVQVAACNEAYLGILDPVGGSDFNDLLVLFLGS